MNKPKWDSPEYGRLWRANNKNKVKINDTKRRIRRQKMKLENPIAYEELLVKSRIANKKQREKYPEKELERNLNRDPEEKRKSNKKSYYKNHAKYIDKLYPCYVNKMFRQKGIFVGDMSKDLIETFKLQIQIKREIKNQNKL